MSPKIRRYYRRLRFGAPVVVVSGLPRSGTSMAMKMLHAGGMELLTDGLRTADEDNPEGYYEFEPVKDLAKSPDKHWLAGARGKAVKIISYLLKELPTELNYKVLFMRRDLDEILASQTKMLERRGEASQTEDARMRELFETDLWRVNYLLEHSPHFEVLPIHYRRVLGTPLEEAARIAAFLGRSLDVDAMAQVVDPELYRNRAKSA